MKHAAAVLLCALALVITPVPGHSQAISTDANWPLNVTALTSPAAPNSAQPQLASLGDRVVLSWVERSGENATLRFSERTDSGWTEASTYAYDLRLAFSRDRGHTWSTSVTPHHDGTQTEHGFASLFPMPGQGLGLAWLDGRQMKEGAHEGMGGGNMSLRGALFAPDGNQASEMSIDDRVCECCPSAAAVTADGPIVAFRNRNSDEIRDIYVSRLVGGKWTEPRAVHNDNWRIAACPVNGPALSAKGRDVAIAWFTAVGDEGRVYAAFSSDAGDTFGSPVRIDDVGAVGRVDVELLADGSAVVTWIEFANQRSEFRIRRAERNGTRSVSVAVSAIASGRSSGYPRVARRGNELIFAWTEPGEKSQVRTAIAQLASPSTNP